MDKEPLRLNIGSGSDVTLRGYVNIDIKFGTSAFPLAYPDGSVDEIYCSHTLEHFPLVQVQDVLKDWVRALKPGGVMKIAVPDFARIAKLYLTGERTIPLFSYVVGSQQDEHDYHKAVFDRISLEHYLKAAGLSDIQEWQSEANDCASFPISLNLMGRKPLMEKVRKYVHIGMALSMPSVSHTATWQCIVDVATRAAMPVVTGGGAFWHAALTRSIEALLEYRDAEGGELDYILTADFDSIFSLDDVRKLATHLAQWDELDCVVPLQLKRERDGEALVESDGPADLNEPLIRIKSGHFGLTMFKRSFFDRLARPWFRESPDADGRWSDGRIDADIGFWRNAEACGLVTCLATDVPLGHYQRVITWPKIQSGKIVTVQQYITDYEKSGRKRPEGV